MLGYGYGYGDPQASWRTTQFHGYLRPADDLDDAFPDFPGPRVGQVVVQEVPPFLGRDLRVSIEFPLPADLAPGEYVLDICDDPCLTPLGWFMPSFLHVGVDPGYPVVRDWPLTDPAIRWLEDDALVAGPSFQPVRAADVRAGRIPAFRPAPPATLPGPDAGATAANAGATAAGQGDTPAPAGNGPAQPESPGDSGTARADADTLTGPAEDAGATPVPWFAVGLVTAALLATVGVAVRRSRRRPGPDDGAPGPGVVPAPDGAGPPEIELVESAGSDDPVTVGALGGDLGGGRSRVRIHL
jgi:hypothetical protein